MHLLREQVSNMVDLIWGSWHHGGMALRIPGAFEKAAFAEAWSFDITADTP